MKKLLILLVLAALAQGLFADDLDGYETVLSVGFEEEEGYVLGPLTGQQGWMPNFSSNKYHPLFWKYVGIEGKKLRWVTQ